MSSNALFNASLAYLAVGRLPTTGVLVTGSAGCGKLNATVNLLEKGGCSVTTYDFSQYNDLSFTIEEFDRLVQNAKKDRDVLVVSANGSDLNYLNGYTKNITDIIRSGVIDGAKIVVLVTNYVTGSLDGSFLNHFIHTEYTFEADITA